MQDGVPNERRVIIGWHPEWGGALENRKLAPYGVSRLHVCGAPLKMTRGAPSLYYPFLLELCVKEGIRSSQIH